MPLFSLPSQTIVFASPSFPYIVLGCFSSQLSSVMDVPETVTEEMILALVEKKKALQVHPSALFSEHIRRQASVLVHRFTRPGSRLSAQARRVGACSGRSYIYARVHPHHKPVAA